MKILLAPNPVLRTLLAAEPEDDAQPWQPDESRDEYWGPDETEYWSSIEAEKKALVKSERASTNKSRTRKVDRLGVQVVEWEQPNNLDATLLGDIDVARKQRPYPITYTVVNPNTDPSTPEAKRRIFANLHRQLGREVEKVVNSGSWVGLAPEVLKEAQGHAAKPAKYWEDMDVTLFEPRVRELVRLLIAKRREAEAV